MPRTTDVANLDAVFKAYDVRGVVPDEIDTALAGAVGSALVQVALGDAEKADERPSDAPSVAWHSRAVVIGHDMRPSSAALAAALAEGVMREEADAVVVGLASTDELYYASGSFGLPGAMVTASHNPSAYNGFKLCRPRAVPIGRSSGLDAVRDLVAAGHSERRAESAGGRPGTRHDVDVLPAYARHLRSMVPLEDALRRRRLTVVVDAGNGMAGHTVPAVLGGMGGLGGLGLRLDPLYFELDGTFPHHEANPIDPGTLLDLADRVRATGADAGLAFDGDADRCFLVDEQGAVVDPSALTALIAVRELRREPGAAVIHNLITSRAVPEIIEAHGGRPVRTRVGHSYIKATMAETDAVFGGEHSGHFYFRDFWRADSGMLAAMHALTALAEQDAPLSELLSVYHRYAASGEVNSTVTDPPAVLQRVEAAYAGMPGIDLDHLDGITVSHDDWWFNVRASNTEPLLRLNAEGRDLATMTRVRDDALALIRRET